MPLIICTVFFVLLFACEAIWFQFAAEQKREELLRYERIEHPSRFKGDSYIDLFS